uniref:Calcipressin-2 n=1 Tax=Mesocestoides corti TaxID=53468 RepID=A0A5K3FGC8_MESCO
MEEANESVKTSAISNRLIVTKVPADVFSHLDAKHLFEEVFRAYDDTCEFIYLPSFRRVIVTMSSTDSAFLARYETQGWRLPIAVTDNANNEHEIRGDEGIRCFFADERGGGGEFCRRQKPKRQSRSSPNTTSFEDEDDARVTEEEGALEDFEEVEDGYEHLALPKADRLFLISPPASPPAGWELRVEAQPAINYDLLHAIAALEPGKAHELHPPEKDQPSIVVTPCEGSAKALPDLKIPHTACPNHKCEGGSR